MDFDDSREHVRSHSPSIAAGNEAAFDRLFVTYAESLRGFVFSYVQSWETAEDLVDEAFLQLWLDLQDAKSIREPKTYLFTAARNRAISYLRHHKVEARHREGYVGPDRVEPEPAVPEVVRRQLPEHGRGLTEDDLVVALHRAVGMLSPRQREIVLLRWQQQLSLEEIAGKLGIASSTASSHFCQAVDRLAALLPPILAELT